MYWPHNAPYWPNLYYYWFVPFRWWPWIISVGKAVVGDGLAGEAAIADEAMGAAIGDVAAGTATIGDDP
jgi:hypothetical protein